MTCDKPDRPARRTFMGAGMGLSVIPLMTGVPSPTVAQPSPPQPSRAKTMLTLNVNGQENRLEIDPRTTLLDALREHLGLSGSKKGCDHGQCGACTVHMDGKSVLSCLTLALAAQGGKITTIEGLKDADGALHPMQQAFIDQDGFQCGYCTPG